MKEDLPKLLSSIKVGASRIREIVMSLRTFSRLDESAIKKVDIHEGIDSTLMILQTRLKASPESPEIKVIKEYGLLPLVECYAGQMNQVFMNILVNAIDALEESDKVRLSELSHNPPQITICTELKDEEDDIPAIAIRIIDNGCGMSEEVKNHLFEPFFTTKDVGKGTGLGLSISYQIVVERHNGKLECFSTPGCTEFTIIIPQWQQKAHE
ncbi:ATP-binding protein [Cronbergia sp. UHCC 0137]|nr:ATP-binding protein [Cronbergia sp. UHCC 0137]MEA5618336.1 ATP-binding protein [Cronbergia sp. UHCC 0137]